jgi:hypothetical protein
LYVPVGGDGYCGSRWRDWGLIGLRQRAMVWVEERPDYDIEVRAR